MTRGAQAARSEYTIWLERGLFVLAGLFCVLVALTPMGLTTRGYFVPDLLSCLVLAWVIRRPDSAPFLLIAPLALFADLMLNRPLGLWALMLLLGSEMLRVNRHSLREQVWVLEWVTVVVLLAIMLLGQYGLMEMVFANQPGLRRSFEYWQVTALAYPPVVAVLHWILKIRAPRLKDGPDRLGRVA